MNKIINITCKFHTMHSSPWAQYSSNLQIDPMDLKMHEAQMNSSYDATIIHTYQVTKLSP